jgi:ketosteroid isomerase-like protein
MHAHEAVLRREYEAFARGDLETLDELLSDDIVYHVPGRNPLSGTLPGRSRSSRYSGGIGTSRSRPSSTT